MRYNPLKIEKKRQAVWEKTGIFRTIEKTKKPKFYCLDMFPYPSGEGLHVGHIKGYIGTDVIARTKLMQGFNVLHPMGWDAFGLPAENYAIKTGVSPEIAVRKNIANFKKQLKKIGLAYDWTREINTTDPGYYKWTQWMFLQMFKNGLAFESFEPVYFCPSCKTGLALEDLDGGKCERCGSAVEKKPLRQWVLKITDYAEKLLEGLKSPDWEDFILQMQKNWIGKSEGAEIKFRIVGSALGIKVFTTRLDTIFGCSYLVLAPENKIIPELEPQITNLKEVKEYLARAKSKTDLQREAAKEKTGVELKGVKCVNPFNDEELLIFVADYVLSYYGTGAVMAVPAHDKRDYDFARKYRLPIKKVIAPIVSETIQNSKCRNQNENVKFKISNDNETPFIEDGILTDSGQFSGLGSASAREQMAEFANKRGFGERKIYYKMRDWVFSRQRYWGEPIPLVFCGNCRRKLTGISNFQFLISKQDQISKIKIQNLEFNKGELLNPGWIALPEKSLPLKLPKIKKYRPFGTGESPLASFEKWVNVKCPKCGGPAKRETNTMPQWAGSSWYYLRYIDPENKESFVAKKKERRWMPVDLYVGGAEHATRHLIYARFWHKFLAGLGAVSTEEPFKKLRHVGVVLAEDNRKMSKRWKNVLSPDDAAAGFGVDSLRLYEMFMGPFGEKIAWQTNGVSAMKRFLERVWGLSQTQNQKSKTQNRNLKAKNNLNSEAGKFKLQRLLHQTIKKVTEDIESLKFNTAISQLMIFFNELEKEKKVPADFYLTFIKLLAPFTPHFSEEIWQIIAAKDARRPMDVGCPFKGKSIFKESWPEWDEKLAKEEEIILIVQVNGKFRDKLTVKAGISELEAKDLALASEKIKKWIEGKEIKKIIFVPDKLINIVVSEKFARVRPV